MHSRRRQSILSVVGERTYGSAPELYGPDVSSFGPEDASIGWRSGKALGSSENLLDFTVGRVVHDGPQPLAFIPPVSLTLPIISTASGLSTSSETEKAPNRRANEAILGRLEGDAGTP